MKRLTPKIREGLFRLLDMGRADYESAPENWEPEEQAKMDAALEWMDSTNFPYGRISGWQVKETK